MGLSVTLTESVKRKKMRTTLVSPVLQVKTPDLMDKVEVKAVDVEENKCGEEEVN
ncbi:hypothetical protein AcW1_003716 [Taiwanofungus camphoratus]|nr:hypothetical protein AcW1_003716 [Antrodia cinnamomea]